MPLAASSFDISTLRTGFVPDAARATEINQVIESQEKTYEDLERQMFRLEDKLDWLRSRRDAIRSSVSLHKALLAPMRRLAPEILMEIFENYVEGSSFQNCPLILTHVCHGWRLVAQGSPRLWTSLACGTKAMKTTYLTRLWLQNSGSLPLDVHLDADDGPNTKCLSIMKEVARFRKLDICGKHENVTHITSLNTQQQLVHLHSLSLQSLRGNPGWINLMSTSHSHWNAPNLHFLKLGSTATFLKYLQPTTSLRHIVLIGDGWDDEKLTVATCASFFEACPCLEDLEISVDSVYSEGAIQRTGLLMWPSLRRLTLRLRSPLSGGIGLFTNLRAPRLDQLEFYGYGFYDDTDPVTRVLRQIIDNSQSTLTRLSASLERFSPHMVRMWLMSATNIRELAISTKVVNVLIPRHHENQSLWPCPRLSSLELTDYMADYGLVELLQHRSPPAPGILPQSGNHYITSIDLSKVGAWHFFTMQDETDWEEIQELRELGKSRGFSIQGLYDEDEDSDYNDQCSHETSDEDSDEDDEEIEENTYEDLGEYDEGGESDDHSP